jgi:hypothetical protein
VTFVRAGAVLPVSARVTAVGGGEMPPGLWLAETLSRQFLPPPRTETGSHSTETGSHSRPVSNGRPRTLTPALRFKHDAGHAALSKVLTFSKSPKEGLPSHATCGLICGGTTETRLTPCRITG